MPLRCVAVGCKNSRRTGHKMHTFPRDSKRRFEWAVKVNLAGENGKLWVPPKDCNYGVCEAHFDEDQYEPRRQDRKLKPFAVPTIFAHRKQPKKRKPPNRIEVSVPVNKRQDLVDATSNDHTYLSPNQDPNGGTAGPAKSGIILKAALTRATKKNGTSGSLPGAADNINTDNSIRPANESNFAAELTCDTGEEATHDNGLPTVDGAPKQPTILMGPAGTILVPCSNPGTVPAAGSFVLVGSTLIPISTVPGQQPVPDPPAALQPPPPAPSPQVPLISSVQSLCTGESNRYPLIASKSPSYDDLVRENQRLKEQLSSTKQVLSDSIKQMYKVRTSLAKQSERLCGFFNVDQVEAIARVGEQIAWSVETLKYSVELYSASAEVYRKLLDRKYPFPPVSALKNYCKKNNITEGVPPEISADRQGEDTSDLNVVWL